MKRIIAGLAGDGVGPEVFASARQVLDTLDDLFGLKLEFRQALIGGAALDAGHDTPLPDATLAACNAADAILLGAVGGPRWDDYPENQRPEQGLLALRRHFDLFGNLRPVLAHSALAHCSPLKADRLADTDIMIVRELTGGIYFGDKQQQPDQASDLCIYRRDEIERVARMACRIARERSGRLTSVDKANVLATSRLWRQVVGQVVAEEFPDIRLDHLLVDAAAMHLINAPSRFDVILTENMFGDILSDEASMIVGSLGLLPSASLNADGFGLYEPIHGSAPDIAGKDSANPYAMLLSVAMMLRHSLNATYAAETLERCIYSAWDRAVFTADLGGGYRTQQITEEICQALESANLNQRVAACYE